MPPGGVWHVTLLPRGPKDAYTTNHPHARDPRADNGVSLCFLMIAQGGGKEKQQWSQFGRKEVAPPAAMCPVATSCHCAEETSELSAKLPSWSESGTP
eukprot:3650884-Rhodomonas_salina.3